MSTPYNPNQNPQNQPPYDPSQMPQPGNQPAYDPSLSPYGNPSSGSFPAQGPQSGAQPYEPTWGQQPTEAYGQPPAYGQAPGGFDQSGYGGQGTAQQPPYGAPYAGGDFGGGFGGPPPQKNNKPLIIGGAIAAVLAIAATVLFFVLNKDDEKRTADGGSGGSGGSSLSCAPGDAGIKIDAKTGESITCDGNSPEKDKAKKESSMLSGSWKVAGTIKSATETTTKSDGTSIGVGDNPFEPNASWSIMAGVCADIESCAATITDEIGGVWKLEFKDDKWVGETSFSLYCDSSKTKSSDITVKYEFSDIAENKVTGTRELSDLGECGSTFKQVDDVTLTK